MRIQHPTHIIKIILFLVTFLIGMGNLYAQPSWFNCNFTNVSNCNSVVPSIFVDLRGYPSYKWYSCELTRGSNQDTCCGMPQIFSNERCLEFKILLDPATEGFLFELINSGQDDEWKGINGQPGDKDAPGAPNISNSGNSGNFEYRINCDPNWYTSFDPICIDDIPGGWTLADTLFVNFCMTGNNDNIYRIKALKAEINPTIEATAEDCGINLSVNAPGVDSTTVTWSSAQNPQYDAYLTYTSGRLNNSVFVPAGSPLPPGNPPVLIYDVCGSASANIPANCSSDLTVCTQVQVTIEPIGSIVINYPEYCQNDVSQYLPTATVLPANSYEVFWYNGAGASGTLIDQGINLYTPNSPYTTPGTKSVAVENPTYGACSRRIQDFVITLKPVPDAVINPPTEICVNQAVTFTAQNEGAGAVYVWDFGSGASPSSHTGTGSSGYNPPTVTYSTCGDKTITLNVTLDGCTDTDTEIVPGDTQQPVITCPPNITVNCDDSFDPSNTGNATVTDNCGATISYSDNIVPGPCSGTYTIERTWMAQDSCTPMVSCMQTITVQDNVAPTIGCNVADLVLECDQDYATEINTWLNANVTALENAATDNCGIISVTHNYTGALPTLDCNGTTGLVVNFNVEDDCGNAVTCSAQIIIDDEIPPVINCAVDTLKLQCDGDYLTEIQNWVSVTTSDILSNANDNCGQMLNVTDDWNGSDVPVLDCNGTTGISVTFTVSDACMNSITCTGEVVIIDTIAPIVTCVVDTLFLQCQQDHQAMISAWVGTTVTDIGNNSSDDCGPAPVVGHDWTGQVPVYDCNELQGIEVTFSVTDQCGNVTTCIGPVIMIDDQPPTVNCVVNDLILECDPMNVNDSIINWIAATEAAIEAASFDDCGDNLTVTNDWDNLPPPLSCDQSVSKAVTFTITDVCGNATTCTGNIFIDDETAPTINCPNDLTVGPCISQADIITAFNDWLALFSGSDICGSITEGGLTGLSPPDSCGGFIDVTYTATDVCLNVSTCTRTFTVLAPVPVTVSCPVNQTLSECTTQAGIDAAWASWVAQFSYANGCDVTETDIDAMYDPPDTCGGQIIVTYTATDACSSTDMCTVIFAVDPPTPVTVSCPPDQSVPLCASQATINSSWNSWIIQFSYSNGCDVTATDLTALTPPDSCGGVDTVWYVAIDDCGTADSCMRIFTVPTPDAVDIECPGPLSAVCDVSEHPPYADWNAFVAAGGTAFGNCAIVPSSFQLLREISDSTLCAETVTRTYYLEDMCGNADSCIQVITINDVTPPSIVCPPNITTECSIGEIDTLTLANFELLGGTFSDNCGVDTLRLVSEISDGNTCPETITRTYEVADVCGNVATCQQLIIIDDVTPPTITCPTPLNALCDITEIPPYTNLDTFLNAGGSAADNCALDSASFTFISDVSNG
ncbi:MAG: PKD domain-containing protein, partial [Saprospiraceae bacterium]|nr:PKD domain-containing protein [Saprospiraceae bacterium]